MNRADFLSLSAMTGAAAVLRPGMMNGATGFRNVLIFTVDDMDYMSPNFAGFPVKDGLTPNMDRLASEALYFSRAHVSCAVCQPARQSTMTGKHPHVNGSMGFVSVPEGVPSLPEILMRHGWFTGSTNKGRDYRSFEWSHFIPGHGGRGFGRVPEMLAGDVKTFIGEARKEEKPFFIGVHTGDPHRGFPGSEQSKQKVQKVKEDFPQAKDRIFAADYDDVCSPSEAWIPPYLPQLPAIRREMAQYYNGVHRADQSLGAVLKTLEAEGVLEETLVVFYSDNGASFPTSKQNCYPYSTRTPLLLRFPGAKGGGRVDRDHFVSTMDVMPTILDIQGLPAPKDINGRSLVPLFRGRPQKGRDHIFTTYNYVKPGVQVCPKRAIHTKKYSYIFNPWPDGETETRGERQSGLTFAAMQAAAETDEDLAERVDFILHRTREELYDREKDPWCLNNVIDDPDYARAKKNMKALMEREMRTTGDPLLSAFLEGGSFPAEWSEFKG
ncbi:sulfatase [Kiritimatiella glycovorans]|uniref:Choline-sulfatase n=1 Tax=Kiritimatiella glycovorans TaxID=1307763 RepID=A0A0G3EHL6_9BACT|nr:sulfatase [Kiritimatiella glycovorans]AKJ63689.1 Choline-sulfatase [Kiritimatiella glycovorans]